MWLRVNAIIAIIIITYACRKKLRDILRSSIEYCQCKSEPSLNNDSTLGIFDWFLYVSYMTFIAVNLPYYLTWHKSTVPPLPHAVCPRRPPPSSHLGWRATRIRVKKQLCRGGIKRTCQVHKEQYNWAQNTFNLNPNEGFARFADYSYCDFSGSCMRPREIMLCTSHTYSCRVNNLNCQYLPKLMSSLGILT